jgi:large repetitive protein
MSNSRPVNNRNASRWFQSRKRSQLRKALRTPVVEQLEDRRLMAAVPLPQTAELLTRARISASANYDNAVNFFNGVFSGGGGAASSSSVSDDGTTTPEGLSGSVLNVVEVEPNNVRLAPQYINFGVGGTKSDTVNIAGNANTLGDTDWFSFDLNKGDIVDVRLNAVGFNLRLMAFYGPNGEELEVATGNNNFPAPNSTSPTFTDGNVNFTHVVDAPGRYSIRLGDQIGTYSLNLRGYRPVAAAQPAGTTQVLYLDFAGGLVNPQLFNLPLSVARVPALAASLPQIGLTAADEAAVIDDITNRTRAKFNQIGVTGTNGFFPNSGVPGEYNLFITNSKDNPQLLGQPNVTRIIVGGSQATFGIPPATGLLGIAQSIDVGNFDLAENALVMLDVMIGSTLTLPRSGTSTNAQIFAELVADTIAHEAGHTYGGVHQLSGNGVAGIMDQFYVPTDSAGSGIDGIFGTADDTRLQFIKDLYSPTAGRLFGGGVSNSISTIAFGLSTSSQASFVTGSIFNDRNRNGIANTGEETLANRTVFADYNLNGLVDAGEPRTVTAANGTYRLTVRPGVVRIASFPDPNWQTTGAAFQTITVGLNQTVSNINFGQFLPNQTVTGFKWADFNGNGIRDAGEPGLGGVYIYVDLDGDNRIDVGEPQAITAADGSYTLTPPTSGIFAIREVVSPGFIQTFPGGPGALPDQQEHGVNFSLGVPLRGLDFGNQPARDYGDAPAPYATLFSQDGASHGFDNNLRLGGLLDFELDGQPNSTATGDDVVGLDDEDGVIFVRPIVAGDTQNVFRVNVTNNLTTSSFVSAWVDWNQDGDWNDAGEKVLSDVAGLRGSNDLRFSAPAGVTLGNTVARFRLSGRTGVGPTGFTEVGEVEDYRISVVNELNFAVDDTFTVDRSSTNNILDVQANDFVSTVPGQLATITRIGRVDSSQTSTTSLTTATGAVVTISGANILYTPRAGFQGVDSFTYSIVTSTGATDTATVVVNTVFRRVNPQAIDDSFDLATNDVAIPLNVLANDLQGQGGALTISSFSQPTRVGTNGVSAGTITLGQGGLSLRYTPAPGFGGTASFTYTVIDNNGQQSTANVIVHTLEGARLDDQVELSFRFTDLAGTPITAVAQGQQFRVEVYVDDLRTPNGFQPGVSSAYLDLLYNAGLTRPVAGAAGSGFDFAVDFRPPYTGSTSGSNEFPGLISSLGASAFVPLNSSAAVPVAVLTFDAINSGIAEFVGDPANNPPQTDVNLFQDATTGVATRVPIEQVRYRRSSLSILPVGTVLPVAVDDGQFLPIPLNSIRNEIRVLANDIVGTNRVPSTTNPGVFVGPEIRITNFGNGRIGTVALDNRGTANPADDVLIYTPNPTVDPNFAGTDQFTYTITDVAGISSTGTVTLQVGNQQNNANALVQLRLETTNLSGTPITQVPVTGQFQLRGYVRDLRAGGANQGVFAAYQDILFDRNLASVNSGPAPLNFAVDFTQGPYGQAVSGNTRIPGLIDELGATQNGNDPLGGAERLQFVVTLTANAAGTIEFLGDPADVKPFQDSLLFESPGVPVRPLLPSEIRYLRTSITVGNGAAGEGFTNTANRFDVNNDGFTSPIDVLVIINTLNRSGIRQLTSSGEGEQSDKMFIDVNGDGYVSPLDVLQVINALSARKGSGEGESVAVNSVVSPVVESVASESFESDLDSIVDAVATDIVKRRRV